MDIDELKTVFIDLSKLSNVVKNEIVKRTAYDDLVEKVNAIETSDTSNLIEKADCDTKIEYIENKISNHDKYIIDTEFDKLMKEEFTERLRKKKLATNENLNIV